MFQKEESRPNAGTTGRNRVTKNVKTKLQVTLVQTTMTSKLELRRGPPGNGKKNLVATIPIRPCGTAPAWAKVCVVFILNQNPP